MVPQDPGLLKRGACGVTIDLGKKAKAIDADRLRLVARAHAHQYRRRIVSSSRVKFLLRPALAS